jgi:alanine-synthesizing transaminase
MFARRTHWTLAPNRLSRLIDGLRAQGREIIDLTESNPTQCGFTYPGDDILGTLADPRVLGYEPDPRGLLPARGAVARYYAELGFEIAPRQIFLTTSTSEAYSYIFRLLADPGDTVLVPRPSYPLFEFLGTLNDLNLIPYPVRYHDGWGIDIAALAGAIAAGQGRARAVLVVHPNNPTGSFVSQRELNALVAFARDHGLAVIADEVFRDYGFDSRGERVPTHAGETNALTFTLSGLSKISALPQMKLAWIVVNGPPDLLASALARLEIIADTYLSVSAPQAHALPALLDMRRAIQPQIMERLRENLRCLDDHLAPPSPVNRLKCDGGWYAVLRVPATRSDEDWAVDLLEEERVLVHPGHFYDFPGEGHLVLSLLPVPGIFRTGIAKLLAYIAGRTQETGRLP